MYPELLISREALKKNIEFFRSRSKSTFICPMVKANAYGVGDSLVVGELLDLGVEHFGVARVFEAQRLRRLYPQKKFDVLVFAPIAAADARDYVKDDLTPVVGSFDDLRRLEALDEESKKRLKPLHLKFDLGMTRLGFSFEETGELKSFLDQSNLRVSGLCGHFSKADQITKTDAEDLKNLEKLTEVSKTFSVELNDVHAPNSAALGLSVFDVGSRPGLSLYGLSDESSVSELLEPVLSLKAPIVHVRDITAGTKVSYGGLWESTKSTKIGVLLIGYADGLPRALSGKIRVGYGGESFSQVGAICMDYTMVNLGPNSKLKVGQEVVFFDREFQPRALSNWANSLGCITYELLVGLGDRLNKRVV